jgi:23S rRNA (adenine2503-C2)-methyltransferase
MSKTILLGKTKAEIQEIVSQHKLPKFTATQILDWIYQKRVKSIEEMTNLSKKARSILTEEYEVGFKKSVKVSNSDDGTKKYLYQNQGGNYIEAAYIPEKNRNTLCVSSQVGCKMACEFCMTGRQKFNGNLSSGEIVNQILSLPEFTELTNIVYMGMGEPLDNIDEVLKSLEIITSEWGLGWSPKRVNVSTIGVIPAMKRFIEESKCHLAISIHSPFDEERKTFMPVQNKYKITDIVEELKKHDWSGQRRLSFEYIVFDDFNHSIAHAKELSKLLHGLKCRVNLIRFHKIPDSRLKSTSDTNINAFKSLLENKGIITTIRASRGEDINAACGMLSTKAFGS